MTQENDQAPKTVIRRYAPESFDVIAKLASPVLPSGKQVGKVLGAVALAVLGGSVLASYYLLDSSFWGFIFAIPVLMLISAILHVPSYWGEWQILRQATAAQILRDNTRVALHGHIHPEAGEPILSALSASPCVAYAYEITYVESHYHSEPSKRRTTIKAGFEGIGLTPSFIETKHGRVRLLAWPNFMSRSLDFETRHYADAKHAAEHFRSSLVVDANEQAWVRGGGESLKAESGGLQLDTSVGDISRQELMGFFADLADRRGIGDSWRVKERVLPAGAEVCVIGIYSADRHAIVSDYESTNTQVKLYEGHPSMVELYHRRFFRIIPILVAVLLVLVGIFVLIKIS